MFFKHLYQVHDILFKVVFRYFYHCLSDNAMMMKYDYKIAKFHYFYKIEIRLETIRNLQISSHCWNSIFSSYPFSRSACLFIFIILGSKKMKYDFSGVPPQDQLKTIISYKSHSYLFQIKAFLIIFSINNLFNTSTSLMLLMDRFVVYFPTEISNILRNFFFLIFGLVKRSLPYVGHDDLHFLDPLTTLPLRRTPCKPQTPTRTSCC